MTESDWQSDEEQARPLCGVEPVRENQWENCEPRKQGNDRIGAGYYHGSLRDIDVLVQIGAIGDEQAHRYTD